MAFKIALNPTFKTSVEVFTKNDKGFFDKSTFSAIFERVDLDELEEIKKLPAVEVVRKKLKGWEGLLDEDNKEVEFSESALSSVLKIPEAVLALQEAYWSSIFKQREKN